MTNKDIIALGDKYLTPNYARRPIALVKGKKASVWDADGAKYLDFVSGLAVANLGHAFTPINKAVAKQMSRLTHVSNLYYTDVQSEYAAALVEAIGGKGQVFFCNSGTEANEAAIKLARRYSLDKFDDKNRTEIIAFDGSFHGRTAGSLSLTGQKKFREGFGPSLSGVKFAPFNDLEAVEKLISAKTCAVIVEPIQGEIGVHVPDKGFLSNLAKLCHKHNVLLILDEVQTGFSRTGMLFAHQFYKVRPDIMTMAKGIANGLPMGAMYVKSDIATHLVPGTHASTFGGNAAVAAGALVALEELSKEALLENVRTLSRYALLKLTGMKNNIPMIVEVRGLGLMIGVELDRPCASIVEGCAAKGLLVNCANETTVRFLPPLNISKNELDKALTIFQKALGGK